MLLDTINCFPTDEKFRAKCKSSIAVHTMDPGTSCDLHIDEKEALKPDTNTKTESETKFEERPKAMSAE